MRKQSPSFVCLLVLSCTTRSLQARVYSPWITSEHVADTSSLEAFRRFPRWRDKTGQDLALSVWHYLVDRRTGLFHFQPVREGPDPVDWEFRIIRDPIKLLNVYGYAFCGAFGPTTAGIFEGVGLKPTRAVLIPGCNHCVTEVWYDGAWHYYDTDLRGVVFKRDGKTVASVEDLIRDPELWTKPTRREKPFFPADPDLSVYARTYGAKPISYCHRWFMGGSTMDFYLRKGETFTRFWHPQGGRWSHQEQDAKSNWWRRLILRPPRGPKCNHPSFSVWTYGNGLFEYEPVLKAGCGDFQDGVYEAHNVKLTEYGITTERSGAGFVIFEVLSPYVIVPKVGDLDDRSDDCEASTVTFSSTGRIDVDISCDFGRTYLPCGKARGQGMTKIDLTKFLRERYQYLLRFTLQGPPGASCLRTLQIRTWVQVAPASLPRLQKGLNKLTYRVGDKYGLPTVPTFEIPNMGDPECMARYFEKPPSDYNPKRFTARLKGEAVIEFRAPPGRKIVWASIGGFLSTHQGKAAARTANEIAYALSESGPFVEIHRSHVPNWQGHWHYAFDREVKFPRPSDILRVRYVGRPGVNGVRVNLHTIKPGEVPERSVIVTHGYRMAGKLVEKKIHLKGPCTYTVNCPQEPENLFIRLSVPSDSSRKP